MATGTPELTAPTPKPSASPIAKATPEVPDHKEVWYDSAYQVLPMYALSDPDKFWRKWAGAHDASPRWYKEMCRLEEMEPDPRMTTALKFHKGKLSKGAPYLIIEYPKPATLQRSLFGPYLHAYYSAFLPAHAGHPAACFALGQSPVKERTTLRRVTRAGHYSLGEGPEPTLEAFQKSLETAFDRPTHMGVVRDHDLLNAEDEKLRKQIPQGLPGALPTP